MGHTVVSLWQSPSACSVIAARRGDQNTTSHPEVSRTHTCTLMSLSTSLFFMHGLIPSEEDEFLLCDET